MRHKSVMGTLFLTLVAFVGLAVAQPGGGGSKGAGKPADDPPAAKTAAASEEAARPVQQEVDGDQAYKANCTRCHTAPRKFSAREMVTVMRHMRIRANLTKAEEEAILRYLTR